MSVGEARVPPFRAGGNAQKESDGVTPLKRPYPDPWADSELLLFQERNASLWPPVRNDNKHTSRLENAVGLGDDARRGC